MNSRSNALFTCLQTDLDFPIGEPSPLSTWREYAKSYLLRDVYKKLCTHINEDADQRALDKFRAVNTSCSSWTLESNGSWDDELIGSLKDEIYKFWNRRGEPLIQTFAEISSLSRPGPGASIGASGNDFYTKMFSSQLTATSDLMYDLYIRCFEHFPLWRAAEKARHANFGDAQVVEGSRLSFVPKSNDISRCICIEPSLNMFFQLGIGARLEERLGEYFGIHLDTQPIVNRELARLGSIDGSYATIDLSSASDSLSLRMLREFLPSDFLSWLGMFRSPKMKTPDGWLELEMVSTMGNGFTFPLQTMLFSSVVAVAMKYCNIRPERARVVKGRSLYGDDTVSIESPGNWSVFGDDIVVPTKAVGLTLKLLRMLGFKVNDSKSFVEGPFRESCGCDYFNGHNVRPVFVKSLETQQDRYVAINAFNEWTARTGIPLPNTLQYLISTVREVYVPYAENDDSGIRIPESLVEQLARKSKKRHERPLVKRDRNGSYSYSCYRSRQVAIHVLDGSFLFPWSMKGKKTKLIYNPDGLLLSFLRGDVVASRINVRHNVVRYSLKRRVTPYWDYVSPTGALEASYYWRQWNTAVYVNLT